MKRAPVLLVIAVALWAAGPAAAQSAARPFGRVSFYTNGSRTTVEGLPTTGYGEFITSVAYQLPDRDTDGLDYGVDLRHSMTSGFTRPSRSSIYEGFVGARLMGGKVRARAGHLWLTDLGALGSVAGALVEVRRQAANPTTLAGLGRLRFGIFGGLEPNVAELGYAADVRKIGGYVALDAAHARRHVVGFVAIRDGALNERSVITTTNFIPAGRRFFLYQAAEYDVRTAAGQGRAGLTYFMANARVSPTDRVEVQGTYNRGRSVDTRGLVQDILNERPISQSTIDGLLYESVGGRVTVEVVRRVRVYAGVARDKTNREDTATARMTFGGYAGDVMRSGFDLSGSDALIDGPTRRYHSRFISGGRQIGRSLYLSVDYSTSLSVLRFSRSDGVVIEMRPETTRWSGNATVYLNRAVSLLAVVEATSDDTSRDVRFMSGVTYRFQ